MHAYNKTDTGWQWYTSQKDSDGNVCTSGSKGQQVSLSGWNYSLVCHLVKPWPDRPGPTL